MSKKPTPNVVLGPSISYCHKSWKTNSCRCRKNSIVCPDYHRYINYAACENDKNFQNMDDEIDENTDFCEEWCVYNVRNIRPMFHI